MKNLSKFSQSQLMRKTSWRIFKKNGIVVNAFASAIIALSSFSTQAADVLPTDGNFVSGSGTIGTNGNTMNIGQTSQTGIINWNGFSIGNGNTVNFNNGNGATMNRVVGNNTSQIYGNLNATGSVYLINQNGVVVGPSGQITTGGSFVASTRDISNEDFQNGKNNFNGTSNGSVVNLGKISATGGDVILVGKTVENAGSINANGDAILGAGDQVVVLTDAEAGERMHVQTGAGSVSNSGDINAINAELKANGGNIFGLAINNTGVIKATKLNNDGGNITLSSKDANVENAGTLDASSNTGKGGTVTVTGKQITAKAASMINTSGYASGGTINFGGGVQGKDATIQNAQTTIVEKGATLKSDSVAGNGGSVTVWSDKRTEFKGTISANSEKAKGGNAEVSSKEALNFASWDISLLGPQGNGELLLDPTNINIIHGTGTGVSGSTVSDNTLYDADISDYLQNNGSGLSIITSNAGSELGDIFIDNAVIAWSSNSLFTLKAHHDINFIGNSSIDASGNIAGGFASIIMQAGRNINFDTNGFTNIFAGRNGTINMEAAYDDATGKGNWQSGIGSINLDPSKVAFKTFRFLLASGKTSSGDRSDFSGVSLSNYNGTFSSVYLNGFKNVDLNVGGTNQALTGNTGGSLVVNAKNININEDISIKGDLILNAAAFDDTTNNFVNDSNHAVSSLIIGSSPAYFSDGWKSNHGTLNFADGLDISTCCAVTLTSGLDSSNQRTADINSTTTFGYTVSSSTPNTYKWFEALGFDQFDARFGNGNVLASRDFVLLSNNTNLINFDITAENDIDLIATGAGITGNNLITQSQITSTNGDISTVSGNSTIISGVSNITATNGSVTLASDENTPTSVGTGEMRISNTSQVNAADGIAIFAANQAQTDIKGTLNGQSFVEGNEFTNTNQEKWGVFYSTNTESLQNPFKVFYKNSGSNTRQDCAANPSQAGCADDGDFADRGKEFRIALAEDNSEPEENTLAHGNSSQVRANEFFVLKESYDYIDTKLSTAEKIGTFWYAIPLQLVNIPLSGLSEVPGIQGIAEGLKAITGGVQGALDNVVVK